MRYALRVHHLLAQHAGMTALGKFACTSCMLCNPLQAYMCTLHGLIQMIISLQGERSSTEMPHPTSCLRQEQPAIIPSGTLSGDARLFVWMLRWVCHLYDSPSILCCAVMLCSLQGAQPHRHTLECDGAIHSQQVCQPHQECELPLCMMCRGSYALGSKQARSVQAVELGKSSSIVACLAIYPHASWLDESVQQHIKQSCKA